MKEPYAWPRTKPARSELVHGTLRAFAVSRRVILEHETRTGKARMVEQIAPKQKRHARIALKGAILKTSSYFIDPISSQIINHSETTAVSIPFQVVKAKLDHRKDGSIHR